MPPPILCPNCGSAVNSGADVCPNCGTTLPLDRAPSSVWPPPPEGYQIPTLSPGENLLTGYTVRDFWIGIGSVMGVQLLILAVGYFDPIVLTALFAVAVLGLIAYFAVRRRFPVVARGIGWGVLAVPLFLLGAIVVCSASFMSSGHGS